MGVDKRPSWRVVAKIIAILLAFGFGVPVAAYILSLFRVSIPDIVWAVSIAPALLISLLVILIIAARLVKGQRRLFWLNKSSQFDKISSTMKSVIIGAFAILIPSIMSLMSNPKSELYILTASFSFAVILAVLSILADRLYSEKDSESTYKKLDVINVTLTAINVKLDARNVNSNSINSTLQDIKKILEKIEKCKDSGPPPPTT